MYFVKQSTLKNVVLKPCDRGNTMIKSILQKVNCDVGIGNGCSIPVGKEVESLVGNIIYKNEFTSRITEFWTPNTNKQPVNKLPSAKMGTSHRSIQFLQEKLAEFMPLGDD